MFRMDRMNRGQQIMRPVRSPPHAAAESRGCQATHARPRPSRPANHNLAPTSCLVMPSCLGIARFVIPVRCRSGAGTGDRPRRGTCAS
jgi:hypothetical protein